MEFCATSVLHGCSWPDLPTDLLLDISGRLYDARDFVRFHAVYRPWRDVALSRLSPAAQARRHKFLPWLISQQNGHIMQYPVVYLDGVPLVASSKSRRRYSNSNVHQVLPLSDKSWVASADGETFWLFSSAPKPTLYDLATGDITRLTAFPNHNHALERRMRKPRGVVYGDGTIFLYSFVTEPAPGQNFDICFFTAAILRRGDLAWTVVEKRLELLSSDNGCVAYHNGVVFVCVRMYFWCVMKPSLGVHGGDDIVDVRLETMPRTPNAGFRARNYLLESRGEMLCVSVVFKDDWLDKDISNSLHTTLVVTVHALEEQADGHSAKMRWMERDGNSFADRVLFLGLPASFAVNASELDVEGGCAYFVFLYHFVRCNLSDGEIKITAGPDLRWDEEDKCLWHRPQPVVSPIVEIHGRVQTRNKKRKISCIL